MKFMKMETVVGYIIGMNTFSDGFTTHEIFYLNDLFGGFMYCTRKPQPWQYHVGNTSSLQKLKLSNLYVPRLGGQKSPKKHRYSTVRLKLQRDWYRFCSFFCLYYQCKKTTFNFSQDLLGLSFYFWEMFFLFTVPYSTL